MADVVQRPRQNRTTASRDGEPGAESVGRRRRGRRPSGQDTRAALLSAALEVFGEQGFAGATVRAIAHRAGVDAAMVNHWFGSKRGLFLAAIQVPFDPQQLVEHAISGDPNTVAERIVRTFVTAWDKHPNRFKAVVQSVTTHDAVAGTIRDLVIGTVVRRTTELLNLDHVEWRASLCASQLLGLGLTRYVMRLEPMASANVETVVAAVAPTLQRYFTASFDDLSGAANLPGMPEETSGNGSTSDIESA